MTIETDSLRIVGRENELAWFDRFLISARSVAVAVVAEPGKGKTTFFAAAEALGQAKGWRTARCDDAGGLTLDVNSTPDSFVERVRILLGLGGARERDRIGDRSSGGSLDPVQLLVHDLRVLGPVILFIDDFRPKPAIALWFASDFWRTLKESKATVILAVAGLAESIGAIGPLMSGVLELGNLDEPAVLQYFETIGGELFPPLTEEEILAYTAESVKHPMVLGALTRVLRLLTSPSENSPAMLLEETVG